MKTNHPDHPFAHTSECRKSKRVSFNERSKSPFSSCSSTLTGTESPLHPFSDSEDSCVDTYRVKSLMRETMKGPVYVYGDMEINDNSNVSEKNSVDDDDRKRKHANSTPPLSSTCLEEDEEGGSTKKTKLTVKVDDLFEGITWQLTII